MVPLPRWLRPTRLSGLFFIMEVGVLPFSASLLTCNMVKRAHFRELEFYKLTDVHLAFATQNSSKLTKVKILLEVLIRAILSSFRSFCQGKYPQNHKIYEKIYTYSAWIFH